MMNRTVYVAAGLLAAASLVAGCHAIRKTTYPPEIRYLEPGQVSTTMWRLAGAVARLDQLLAEPALPAEAAREEIAGQLAAMEQIAAGLGGAGQRTNHLLIDQNIDDFLRDVRQARMAVQAEPPNYYPAGRLAGSCAACHAIAR